MYRTLDSEKIVATIDALEARITARFPTSGLARVCAELGQVARANTARAARLEEPNWWLRVGTALVVAIAIVLLGWIGWLLRTREQSNDLFNTLQGIDAGVNLLVLMGATLFFLVSLEARQKRRRALADLHELRSIIHVIDMHQLTKDPTMMTEDATVLPTSPRRSMTAFELSRYLDYCSEMLSLVAKVAALYAQSFTDPVLIDAVNDLERLTANLSQKIWQKITLVQHQRREPQAAVLDRP